MRSRTAIDGEDLDTAPQGLDPADCRMPDPANRFPLRGRVSMPNEPIHTAIEHPRPDVLDQDMKPGEVIEALASLHFGGYHGFRTIKIDRHVRDYLLSALVERCGKAEPRPCLICLNSSWKRYWPPPRDCRRRRPQGSGARRYRADYIRDLRPAKWGSTVNLRRKNPRSPMSPLGQQARPQPRPMPRPLFLQQRRNSGHSGTSHLCR
jgi:hypothetical protein